MKHANTPTSKAEVKKVRTKRNLRMPKGIRQLPNGKFLADATVDGIRRSATRDTLEEAMNARRELLGELTSPMGRLGRPDAWTLQQAYDITWQNEWKDSRSERSSCINARDVLDYFGKDIDVATITTDAIDGYITHLIREKKNADATINRKLSALSLMLRTAHKRGKITGMPIFPRRKEQNGRLRFLTQEEEKALLQWFNHLGKTDHAEATIVLLDTGFRTGELWGVTAAHVSINEASGCACITLWRTKNGKPRTIPLTERAWAIIQRRCKEHPRGQLFPGSSNDWFRVGWERVRQLMKKMDESDWVPHMLRHTCCSRLVQRGAPLTHVQQWMGHSTIQTTMRYAHLAPNDLFTLVDVLNGPTNIRWTRKNDAPGFHAQGQAPDYNHMK